MLALVSLLLLLLLLRAPCLMLSMLARRAIVIW